MAKKALGKGLGAIISTSSQPVEDLEKGVVSDSDRIVKIDVNEIISNPDQPRLHFDEKEIKNLADSIISVGLIQPIIVRLLDNHYVIVAGERRVRAVKLAGLKKIKAIIIEADEIKNFSLALIENIQRSNLDPIEEAKAYRVLSQRFKLKHQEIAKKVGRDRATITNSLRLLNLPEEIQEGLSQGKISTGHAKVLLSLSPKKQFQIYKEILSKSLSVRALEEIAANEKNKNENNQDEISKTKDPHIRKMEEEISSVLGTRVEIKHLGGKGKIEITYYSLDDFERIVEIIK